MYYNLLECSENLGIVACRNVGTYIPVYKAPHSGRLPFSPARSNKLESFMRSALFQDFNTLRTGDADLRF